MTESDFRDSISSPPSRTVRFGALTNPLLSLTVVIVAATGVSTIALINPQWTPVVLPIITTLGLIAIGLLVVTTLRLKNRYLGPLHDLRAWSQRIRSGDLFTSIPTPEKGELKRIVQDINSISKELDTLTEEMDSKVKAQTEHIAAKSRSLEILYDIATDLSTARNLDEMLEQFLDTLMVLVDAKAATVRLTTSSKETYLVASRGLSPHVVKLEQLVPMDRCLCGQIANNGGFGVQKGIGDCNRFLDCNLLEGNCSELVVVPLQYRDQILGVFNLFLDRPSSELGKDARDLLNSIGKHLGLAVEKARLDNYERRLAIMEERNMIGNELHDSLAQSLVSMRLQVKMLGELLHKKDIRGSQNEVRRLKSAIDEAHISLRDLLGNFRTRMDERGLVPAIEDLVLRFKEETGIAIFLQNEWREFTFSPVQEVQVYRIIQEALANIRKHSNACNVRILLKDGPDDNFSIMIEDDGLGIDQGAETHSRPGENLGISIMRERATRLGGTLSIESDAGDGTRVYLACPYHINDRTSSERYMEDLPHARSVN